VAAERNLTRLDQWSEEGSTVSKWAGCTRNMSEMNECENIFIKIKNGGVLSVESAKKKAPWPVSKG